MFAQVVVDNDRKIIEFEIINIHGETFFNLLFDELIDYAIRFSAARAADNGNSPCWIYYIGEPIVPLLFIIKSGWQIYGIFILDQSGFLHETFILIIKGIVHHTL